MELELLSQPFLKLGFWSNNSVENDLCYNLLLQQNVSVWSSWLSLWFQPVFSSVLYAILPIES